MNGHKSGQGEVRKGVVLGTGKIPTRPPAAAPKGIQYLPERRLRESEALIGLACRYVEQYDHPDGRSWDYMTHANWEMRCDALLRELREAASYLAKREGKE